MDISNSFRKTKDGPGYVVVDGVKVGVEYLTFSYLVFLSSRKGLGLVFDYLSSKLSEDKYLDLNRDEGFSSKVRKVWNEAFVSRNMRYVNSLKCLENIIDKFKDDELYGVNATRGMYNSLEEEDVARPVVIKKVRKKYNRKSRVIYPDLSALLDNEEVDGD